MLGHTHDAQDEGGGPLFFTGRMLGGPPGLLDPAGSPGEVSTRRYSDQVGFLPGRAGRSTPRSQSRPLRAALQDLGIDVIDKETVAAHEVAEVDKAGGSDFWHAIVRPLRNERLPFGIIVVFALSAIVFALGLVGAVFGLILPIGSSSTYLLWGVLPGVVGLVLSVTAFTIMIKFIAGKTVKSRARWHSVTLDDFEDSDGYMPLQVRHQIDSIRARRPDTGVTIRVLRQDEVTLDPIAIVDEGPESYAIAIW